MICANINVLSKEVIMSDDKMYIKATITGINPNASRGKATGLGLSYKTLTKGKDIDDFIISSTLKSRPNLKETIDTLKVGQLVKIQKEKNKAGYFSIVAIYTDVDAKNTETRSATGESVDFNTRAARGQALNLALAVAVADKKHHDDKFVLSQVERFLKLGQLVQEGKTIVAKATTKEVVDEVTEEDEGLEELF